MKKIFVSIEYDGTNFSGWQIQPEKRTVQGVIQKAIFELLNEDVNIFASGRTDSGVHAFNQTAHFEINSDFDIKKLPQALNSKLPKDVAILKAKIIKDKDFHCRFSIKQKTYLYKVYCNKIKQPLQENKAVQVNEIVLKNIKKMKDASQYFLGEHNFYSFCSSGNSTKNFNRTIYSIKIKKTDNNIDFYITGNGFLYNMVRIMIGTLIAVGENKIQPEQISEIIKSKNRSLAGKTMPAYGLYLYSVKY